MMGWASSSPEMMGWALSSLEITYKTSLVSVALGVDGSPLTLARGDSTETGVTFAPAGPCCPDVGFTLSGLCRRIIGTSIDVTGEPNSGSVVGALVALKWACWLATLADDAGFVTVMCQLELASALAACSLTESVAVIPWVKREACWGALLARGLAEMYCEPIGWPCLLVIGGACRRHVTAATLQRAVT